MRENLTHGSERGRRKHGLHNDVCAPAVYSTVSLRMTGRRTMTGRSAVKDNGSTMNAGDLHTSTPPHVHTPKKSGPFARLENAYASLLVWSLGHRWVIVVASLAVLFCTVPLGKRVNKNFLPQDDESQFVVSVRAPEGRSLAATEQLCNEIAAESRKLPDVKFTVITGGDDPQQTYNLGSILVQMNDVEERRSKATQYELMERTRKEILSKFPRELRCSVSPPSAFGGGAQSDIEFVITGPSLDTLTQSADKIVAELRKTSGVADADTSTIVGKPELGVTVDRSLAADLGVSVSDIAGSVRILVAGQKTGDYNEDGQQYDVNLRALPEFRDRQASLSLFNVPSGKEGAGVIPLDQVASFKEGTGPSVIKRFGRTRSVTITANLLPGSSMQAVQDKMVKLLKDQNLGPQYRSEFTGSAREMVKTFSSFMMAFTLSLIFMYLILAAQFESWLHPITILTLLPLTVPFALLSLLLLGESLNIYSMLGILVLFGVVKKNAILQVDHANHLREEGMERETAIVKASKDRLRPILMTTIAFVAGMAPLMLSRGTGAATNHATGGIILGGQTLSLILTLVATPVFYSLMDDATVSFAKFKVRVVGMLVRSKAVEVGE